MGVIKLILYGSVIVIVIVIILSFFISEETVVDPPLSNAPYELVGKPLPKGYRILSIDVNMAEDNDYEKAFNLAKTLGSQVTSLSLNWKDIEVAPEKYQDPGDALSITNAYYPPQKMKIALYIRSVDTLAKMTPDDLQATTFTAPEVAERYIKMIDWVFAQLPDVEVAFLSVGDEIDIMMGQNKDLYQQFEVFFREVKEAIKKKRPNLLVSFSATLYGLTQNVPDELKSINKHSDIVLVSYYPVNPDFSVKDPSVIGDEYDELVRMYSNRIIYIEQTGYPTSSLLGSSEAKQREFIRETFKAWDKHAAQIKYISFTWLHDLPQSTLDFYKQYYGSSDQRFMEFLRTLGFRTYADQDKESFRAIKAEAKTREW